MDGSGCSVGWVIGQKRGSVLFYKLTRIQESSKIKVRPFIISSRKARRRSYHLNPG
jgi:hypothetical protein